MKKTPTKNTLWLPWQKVLGWYCWEKDYIRGRGEMGCFRGSEKGWWWGWTCQTEDVSDRSLNFKGSSSGRKKARSSLAFIFFLVYAGLWETLRSTVQNNLSVFSWAVHIRETSRRTRHLWVQVWVWSLPFCTLKTDQTLRFSMLIKWLLFSKLLVNLVQLICGCWMLRSGQEDRNIPCWTGSRPEVRQHFSAL